MAIRKGSSVFRQVSYILLGLCLCVCMYSASSTWSYSFSRLRSQPLRGARAPVRTTQNFTIIEPEGEGVDKEDRKAKEVARKGKDYTAMMGKDRKAKKAAEADRNAEEEPSATYAPQLVLGIAQLADAQFQAQQALHYATVRSYAGTFGYEYHLLDPSTASPFCQDRHKDFFFRKHCTVAEFLEKQPPGYVLVVLDGDVVGSDFSAPLDPWVVDEHEGGGGGADIVLYERGFNFEYMAGNYIVRNTEFALQFLRQWAEHEFFRPPGFSSADNGAIHLVVLNALGIDDSECRRRYEGLVALSDNLKPYFEFVACTRRAAGPNRRWVSTQQSDWGLTQNKEAGVNCGGHRATKCNKCGGKKNKLKRGATGSAVHS